AYVPLDTIPLTPNGKLDKRNLPTPDIEQLARNRYVAPRRPDEERMAAIWAQAVGVDRVGVHDDFFELGGDSLRAVTLVGALRTAGFDVSVRDVFRHTTIADLCEAVTGQSVPQAPAAPVQPFELISAADRALLPDGLDDAYPLSQNQTGMLVETLASGERANYHDLISFLVRDEKPFDFEKLTAAVRTVAEQHDILRTSASLTGYSVPMQLVHRDVAIPLGWRDISDLNPDEQQAELRAFVTAERAAPFDLDSSAPLLRIFFHVQGPNAWRCSFTKNHAVLEGWSYHALLKDIVEVYDRLSAGHDVDYEAPRIRFADTVAAELDALASDEQRQFWRDVVDNHTRFTLPDGWHGDLDAPAQRVGAGYSYRHLEPQLRAVAAAAGVPVKAVLHAAHLKVMSQLTSEEHFFTGLVGHTRPEVEGADRLIGMYITTLPHPHTRTAATWGELARQVFDAEVAAWPHRSFPLQAIRNDGRRLLDVFFIYLDFHNLGDEEIVDEGNGINQTETEFGLAVTTVAGQIGLRSNSHVLSQAHVERLVGMYGAVLEAMAAEGISGDARVTRLPDHEHTLVTTGPVSAPSVDGYPLMHGLFEAMVAERPDAVAVVADGTQYTYAEVNERANRIAHLLRSLGARPEDAIGVHLERGPDLIPALLGVLKSGAGYLPLDPVNPVDRLGYIVSDAQARLVITTSDLAPSLTTVYDGQLIVLDTTDVSGFSTENPAVVSSAENAIYTIYTSGSTGRPKGVVLTHTNVARLLTTAQEHFAFDHTDVWSMAHSYAFDVSVFEMWGALAHGGQLIVVPRAVTRSPEEFADLLTHHRVTVLSQTPTAFSSLTALAAANDPRINQLHLRAVIFAGEKLEISGLRPWVDRKGLTAPVLVNMYGITETTVHTTYHALTEQDLEADGNPIGRPLSDLAVHLLNTDGRPVPLGVPGEIHVSGPGVARGYLNRPSLTAERFLPDPYGPPGSRMYRSGDIALRNPDATLDFSGRIDDQVKIRGFRIELGEITAALTNHPDIRQAITIVREDTPGDKRLVAYLVPEPGHLLNTPAIRQDLTQSLPDYMVPTAYIPLDAIPLTANGKLDKRNLPAPDSATLRTADTYTAPRTPLEQHIAEVWRDVLGVDRVGVHDSFFELGGDSLRAVTLVGALRTAGYEVSVRDIFDARTVARLGELTGEAQGHSVVQRLVQPFELISAEDRALLPEDVADAYPLSQNQLGMVVEMLTDDAQNNYHNVSSYWIRDAVPFSAAAFAAAGRVLVERHEALRTSIQLSGYSRPLQLVHQHAEMVTRTIDLTGQDKDSVWAEVRRFATAERADAFDMSVPGLMRYHAHTTSDDGWWLSITECHPIMEGWSYHSLIMELLTTYFALRDGQEPAYEGTPDVRFADAIAAELAALESTEDRAYWNGVVQDHAPLRLPENWGTPEAGAFDAHKGAFPFQHIEPQLRALATATETSLKAVMVAAHLKVMSQLTGEQDFHTGLVCDMRPEMVGADRVAGMYLNTLPFPFRRTARTWGELVRQVFDTEVGLWPHRRYPMPTVQRAWGGTGRMMDVYFNYHDFRQVDTELIDIMAGNDDSPTEFPLTVSSRSGHIILTANRRHIDEINVERLVGMYGAVLEAMAAEGISGDARVTRLPDHEHTLVTTGPVSAPSIDGYPLMHGLFEAMVAERPDAVAVVADGTQYTYAEVNERANRIAHLLRSLGARPEDAIGVHLERGPDLIPALLGVLKSGAGYLPLDPVNPVDRLGYIVSDAQARLVITTSDLAPTLTTVYDGQLIVLDTTDLTDLPTENPAVVSSAENAIYTIYTSGSTGRPKGVVLTHVNVARLLTTAQEHFAFDHTDVWSMAHSYAFDVSVFEMWGALAHGGQ
ncbi:non-ribosomal peptide synthetase, partial [Streptomyces clavuligerus]|uniref:non-ribosomal peptide synthetase n=2 Tax=Streptomyces clavuligerus TaxID=1901 RepID=UPI0018D06611